MAVKARPNANPAAALTAVVRLRCHRHKLDLICDQIVLNDAVGLVSKHAHPATDAAGRKAWSGPAAAVRSGFAGHSNAVGGFVPWRRHCGMTYTHQPTSESSPKILGHLGTQDAPYRSAAVPATAVHYLKLQPALYNLEGRGCHQKAAVQETGCCQCCSAVMQKSCHSHVTAQLQPSARPPSFGKAKQLTREPEAHGVIATLSCRT
jgi:hypothetical protein